MPALTGIHAAGSARAHYPEAVQGQGGRQTRQSAGTRDARSTSWMSTERKVRDLAGVRIGKASIDKALAKARKHMDSMGRMYETLAEEEQLSLLPPIRGQSRMARSKTTVA